MVSSYPDDAELRIVNADYVNLVNSICRLGFAVFSPLLCQILDNSLWIWFLETLPVLYNDM